MFQAGEWRINFGKRLLQTSYLYHCIRSVDLIYNDAGRQHCFGEGVICTVVGANLFARHTTNYSSTPSPSATHIPLPCPVISAWSPALLSASYPIFHSAACRLPDLPCDIQRGFLCHLWHVGCRLATLVYGVFIASQAEGRALTPEKKPDWEPFIILCPWICFKGFRAF